MNFIKNFFKPTVDSIVADFNKTVSRLEDLADVEFNKAEALFQAAQEHLKEHEERKASAAKASAIAFNIKALINA